MSRRREPGDWAADRSAARLSEEEVGERLRQHPQIARFADLTEEMDTLDFSFRFEQAEVRVDVKAKLSRSSNEIAEQWPDVPRDELFILDETAFRTLVWDEGLGYLIVKDEPRQSWHVFGPWELCLGPRRRFERLGDMGAGEFLKGKLLLDLRSASSSGPALDVDAFLDVVRRTRSALRQVRAIEVRGEDALPVIPRPAAQAGTAAPTSIRPEDDPPVADPGADEEWAGLSADLVQTVKRRWDWSQPTDVQRLAFPAVLAGANTLVLGPTAGGKTEAALLPLMDLWRRRGWTAARPSLLVVSPLRALIDDQLVRWRRGGALVGAKVASWHGGTTRDERRAFKDNPTDVLLITPESLELLMTSSSHDERTLFEGLQAVVVDEVHSFAGTARGAQLVSLLERLDRFVAADLQRVGLSATVGNPTDVLAWLRGWFAAGARGRRRRPPDAG